MLDAVEPSTILSMLGLVIYHFVFFGRIYLNPMSMATSELLSTFFPTWLNGGKKDDYWLVPNAHPVISAYYPFSSALSYLLAIPSRTKLDDGFRAFLYLYLLHFVIGSIGYYIVLLNWFNSSVAFFGAITCTYQAFNLKQQPCIAYTHGWFPWCLSPNPVIAGIAVSMLLLAGYYPLAIYLLPVVILVQLLAYQTAWPMLGILVGLIQIVPFVAYLPKTIRKPYGEGQLGHWELKFYFGIAPLIILAMTFKPIYLTIFLPILASYGIRKWLPRGYQRAWVLSVYIAMYFCLTAMVGMNRLNLACLIILQAFDLWLHNSQLLPPRPFCELPRKPSLAFNTPLTRYLDANLDKDARVSGLPFPLFTGLVNGYKTLGYCGSMQLKLMAKWRGDTDPNGSGHHDYFMGKEDGDGVDIARIQFAHSRKKLNWPSTGIKHLYANPRYNLQGR